MEIFKAIIEIFICFFCVLGVYFSVTRIMDKAVMKNSKAKCLVLIEECDKENLEYLVRFLEDRMAYGEFQGLIKGVGVGCGACAEAEILNKLCVEYGNIYLI